MQHGWRSLWRCVQGRNLKIQRSGLMFVVTCDQYGKKWNDGGWHHKKKRLGRNYWTERGGASTEPWGTPVFMGNGWDRSYQVRHRWFVYLGILLVTIRKWAVTPKDHLVKLGLSDIELHQVSFHGCRVGAWDGSQQNPGGTERSGSVLATTK